MRVMLFGKKMCPACKDAEAFRGLGQVEFFDIDTAEGLAEAAYFEVRKVPALLLCMDGKVLARWDGLLPSVEQLLSLIKEYEDKRVH